MITAQGPTFDDLFQRLGVVFMGFVVITVVFGVVTLLVLLVLGWLTIHIEKRFYGNERDREESRD